MSEPREIRAEVSSEEEAPKATNRHTGEVNGVHYDVYALERLTEEVPVEEVPTEIFQEHVAEGAYSWNDQAGKRIGPHDLLKDWDAAKEKEELLGHLRGVEGVDLERPIIVLRESGQVLDGMHRLTKAYRDRRPTISVRYVDEIPQEAILPPKEEPQSGEA